MICCRNQQAEGHGLSQMIQVGPEDGALALDAPAQHTAHMIMA